MAKIVPTDPLYRDSLTSVKPLGEGHFDIRLTDEQASDLLAKGASFNPLDTVVVDAKGEDKKQEEDKTRDEDKSREEDESDGEGKSRE